MNEVKKGVVSHFSGGLPVVRPFGSGDALTPPLVNNAGQLYVGNKVAFALFEDGTGVVLAKM